MDRNTSIGLILITGLLFAFFYFSSPGEQPEGKPQAEPEQTISTEEQSEISETPTEEIAVLEEMEPAKADSVRQSKLADRYSDFAGATQGEAEIVTVTTDQLTVNINTKGGYIESAYLNNYKTHDSLPLPVVAPNEQNEFYFEFGYKSRRISTQDLIFIPSAKSLTVTGEDEQSITFVANAGTDRFIEQTYTFRGNTYDLGYSVRMKGLKEGLNQSYYEINWKSYLPRTELAINNMRQKTGVVYKMGDEVDEIAPTDETEEEKLVAKVKWVSFKSQFFSHIFIAEEDFRSGKVRTETVDVDSINRVLSSRLTIGTGKSDEHQEAFTFYMGPNEYTTLVSYDQDLEQTMDLGWSFVSWINKGTTYVFKFLEKYISDYGIIIILLAFMIRLLTFPFSFKSYVSMAKMRVINNTPEVKAIDEKYKDDQQKAMMAKQGLYREMGVSMLGGCLPMLLSYPFLIALFFFFPQSVELRQQGFLWADDLSTYDSIISWTTEIPILSSVYGNHVSLFTLLMAISTFIYTYYQQQSQPSTGANSQMRIIAYVMPIFLLVFLNNYASGLSLYYLTSNIIQITQTTVIRKFFVNDEKLLKEMRDKQKKSRKKNGKKGGGNGGGAPKSRIERWVEKQQKKQEQVQKQQRGQQGNNRRSRRSQK
ncbi:MAG: membrane protein insertase YidC [Bacteroidota bacterium]